MCALDSFDLGEGQAAQIWEYASKHFCKFYNFKKLTLLTKWETANF
jgi:hypothetical protein